MFPAGVNMPARVGKPAPDFSVNAYVKGAKDAKKVSLSDYRGKWVVLFFYPRDFTFVCPTEIEGFAKYAKEFRKEDAEVIGASTDSFWSHRAWYEGDGRLKAVEFPVLADTGHQLSRDYDVLIEESGTALRGTFIIDPKGVLQHSEVNNLDVGRNVDETLRLLQAFRTGKLCPVSWKPGEKTLN